MSTQPPIEDINAIVSRFQAWAGAQAPARATDGVRKLSYEEALRRRRQRMGPQQKASQAEPEVKPAVRNVKSASPSREKPESATRKPVPRKRAKHAGKERVQVKTPEPLVFRQILAAQVQPEEVAILPAVSKPESAIAQARTTALSLRISPAEHALLKQRAAAANLSVSCYLRNCVVEVEKLRAELALLRNQQLSPALPPSPATLGVGGFFRRLILGRNSTLTLRA